VESHVAPKAPLQFNRCQRFGHTQRNCGYSPRCVACGDPHLSGECSTPKQQLKYCSCGVNYTANYWGSLKWKEAKAALVRRGQPERRQASGATGRPAAPNPTRARPSAERESLGPGWNHVVQGDRVVKATKPTHPEPSPKSATAAPHQSKVTVTKKGGAAANHALKSTKALRQAQVKNTQEKVKSGKSSPKIPSPLTLRPRLKLPSRPSRRSPIYPHFRGDPLAGGPQNRCPLSSRIWQHGLEG
jgi:hypothetical protein